MPDKLIVTPAQARSLPTTAIVPLCLVLCATVTASRSFAGDSPESTAEQARSAWDSGAIDRALDMLDEGLGRNPQAAALHKLRGDILATTRRPQEARAAYDAALTARPTAMDVRWAQWSVLLRSGQADDAIKELRRMAQIDKGNPIIHLRLAQELRKLDRLEESLDEIKRAVELAPDLLGWRLTLARARFDLLDYQGAEEDVRAVLKRLPPGSSLALPATTLLALIEGQSTERGRRFNPVLTREGTPEQRREWAAIRADAWELFAAGRYAEAEPVYRRILKLNPSDSTAAHQLGLTLMHLNRCEDALGVFGVMANLDPNDDEYTDTVFRMGQCLVELNRWEEAWLHFQVLYDAAVEFETSTIDVALPSGTRVLDKTKLNQWLEKIRPHVPDIDQLKAEAPIRHKSASEEELYAKVVERLQPQKALDTKVSLMGRDADFSWFRFVIPAGKVLRDDFPTGAHEFIPLNPGDSFPVGQQEIYLVFALVSSSYDAVPLTAQCVLETADLAVDATLLAQDRVMTSMNDQSGYFQLSAPKGGWPTGLYRCGLFAGERTSADTLVDEVRFRIVEPARPS